MESSLKLIYIMGRGHSGTTMLDALLGASRDAFSMGEIVAGCLREEDVCSCGHPIKTCEFWNSVMRRFEFKANLPWTEFGAALKKQSIIWKYLPMVLPFRKTEKENFAKLNYCLLEAVSEEAKVKAVVDSSKEVTRGLFLAKYFEDVRIIHIVRNPLDILVSNIKRIEKGEFKFLRINFKVKGLKYFFLIISSLGWLFGNILAESVSAFRSEKVLRIKYEDLIKYPEKELNRIGRHVGLNLDPVIKKMENKEKIIMEHMIAGNGMRRSGNFIFRSNDKVENLPKFLKATAFVICYPLLKNYQYI